MSPDDQSLHRPITLRAPDGVFLPVERAAFEVRVDGPRVTTEADITFRNETGRTVEADLVLPLPPMASVQGLQARWGQHALDGVVRGKEAARADYQAAVSQGHSAVLGEGEGEDLVRLRLGPIETGASVMVSLTILHGATPTLEGHRVVLPLTYMPRYVEDPGALTATEAAALDRPRPVTLDARASVRFVVRGATAEHVRCASHRTQTVALRSGVEVRVEGVALDRDVLLEVLDRVGGQTPVATVRRSLGAGPDGGGACGLVTVTPPAFADEGPTVPRTVLFLVDRSGSMGGRPMDAAKRAVRGSLRALGADDRFNVIAFDDRLEALAASPVPFTEATLRAADRFVDGLEARGGTEASQALQAMMTDTLHGVSVSWKEKTPDDGRHRLRQVVFMTDGDVAGAAEVLRTARVALHSTRVHVLGIGDAVNHSLLGEIAALGGGTYTPVATDEDLERALLHLKNALYAPVWTGVVATLLRGDKPSALHDVEPQGVWDLFASTSLTFAWRGPQEPGDVLRLAGLGADGSERVLEVALDAAEDDPEVFVRWATMRARRLTYRFDPADDLALEKLGTAFGLITRRTSLVGIDPHDSGHRVEAAVSVSLPLPGNMAEQTRTGGGGGVAYAASMIVGAMPHRTAAVHPLPMARALAPKRAARASKGGAGDSLVERAVKKVKAFVGAASPAQDAPEEADDFKAETMDFLEREESTGSMPALGGMPPSPPPAPSAPRPQVHDPAPEPAVDEVTSLRGLLLTQGADGMFGSVGETLAAVGALVSAGHTHREGDYRAELKRTLATLRGRLVTLHGDEAVWARVAIALLTVPHGIEPVELDPALEAAVRRVDLHETRALREEVIAVVTLCPPGWDASPRAAQIWRRFLAG